MRVIVLHIIEMHETELLYILLLFCFHFLFSLQFSLELTVNVYIY